MRRGRRGSARRLAGVVFAAVALLAAAVPQAFAQPPARPAPQDLWRQFPLDPTAPNRQPPEPRSAPQVTPSTSPTTAAKGSDDSAATLKIAAAIVLAMGFLLLLTTGVLAYAARGHVELGLGGLGRRRIRFSDSVDARQYDVARRTRRRSFGAAAARVHERRQMRAARLRDIRDATSGHLRKMRRTVSSVRERTVRASGQTARNELALLKEILDTYVSRGTAEHASDDQLATLKAKRDVQSAPSSRGEHEVEILKAKRVNEADLLKAKLAGNAAGTDAETETRTELAAKSGERGAFPKTSPKEPAGVASKPRRKQVGRR